MIIFQEGFNEKDLDWQIGKHEPGVVYIIPLNLTIQELVANVVLCVSLAAASSCIFNFVEYNSSRSEAEGLA